MPTLVRVLFLPILTDAPGLPIDALLMPLWVRLILKPGNNLILLRNLNPMIVLFYKTRLICSTGIGCQLKNLKSPIRRCSAEPIETPVYF